MKSGLATYLVLNENTLGYAFSEQPNVMGVLASKPQLGATWSEDPKSFSVLDNIRIATEKDFDFFRVQMPSDAVPVTSVTVVAGKYEEDDGELYVNAKFVNDYDTLEQAQEEVKALNLNSYPFCYFEFN